MLQNRVKTGLILALVALAILGIGGALLVSTALVVHVLASYEYFSIATKNQRQSRILQQVAATTLPPLGYLWAGWPGLFGGLLLAASLLLALAVWSIEMETHQPEIERVLPPLLLPLIYPGLFTTTLVLVANQPLGAVALAWLLAVTVASDTGAYYAGRHFGGEKLSPRVSPSKTLSGAAGGAIAGLSAAVLVNLLLGAPLGIGAVFFFGCLVAFLAQLGDLVESLLKRTFNVKDSSTLLPGHGGVLDRLDAFLFVVPVALLLPI